MSLIPCDRCKERPRGKLTQVTWAWHRADHVRVAWRQRLCTACVASVLAPVYTASQDSCTTCPQCGIDTADDMDPVYATFYPAGLGKMSLEAPMCGPCAVHLRAEAMLGAVQLEDKPMDGSGSYTAPNITAAETWASLGIVPRERP